MKSEKRIQKDRMKMRRRILNAAKNMFINEGIATVSMRRIATAIGYSPAALYRYFRNKHEILSVLRDEGFHRFIEGQKQGLNSEHDPVERLKQAGRQYVRFAKEEPEYYQLMFCSDAHAVTPEGKATESAMDSFELFKQSLDDCLGLGQFGDSDPEVVLFAIWSGVHGLACLINTGRLEALSQTSDTEQLVDNIVTFNLRAVGAV